ncbi:MAG: hypothetical protein V7K50_07025 [Nostoc sp.]
MATIYGTTVSDTRNGTSGNDILYYMDGLGVAMLIARLVMTP